MSRQSSVGQGVGIGCGFVGGVLLACVGLPLAGWLLLGTGLSHYGARVDAIRADLDRQEAGRAAVEAAVAAGRELLPMPHPDSPPVR